MAVILCYGDSNTHGTMPLRAIGALGRYARGQRWPDVLQAALGDTHEVIAEGLPGRTTVHDDPVEGGARNGLSVLPAVLASHAPLDLLVLMLGTNDLKPRFSVSAVEIARSMERLITQARISVNVPDILVVAPVPVRETGCLVDIFAGAQARQTGLEAHMAQAAERQGCGFLAAGDIVHVSDVDGVHWDPQAHLRFGAALADTLLARLP